MHALKHPHAAGALEGEPAPKRPHHSAAGQAAALDAAFTRGRRDQQVGPHTASTRWRSLAQLLGRNKAAATASTRGGAGHVRSSDDGAAARDFVAGAGDGNAEPGQDGVLAAAAARALAQGGGAPTANGSGRRAARGGGAPTPCPSLGSPLQEARVTSAPGVGSTTGSSGGGIPIQVPAPEAAASAAASAAVSGSSGSSSSRGTDSGTQQRSPFAAVSALGTPPPSGGGTRTPSRGASQPGSAGISQAVAVGRSLCTVPERSGLREPPPTPAYSRAQSLEPLPFARSAPTTPPSTPVCLSTSPSAVSSAAPAMPPPLALAAEAAAEARDASSCCAASGSLTTTASTPIAAGSSSSNRSGGCSGAVGVGDTGEVGSGQLSAAMRGLAVRSAAASDSLQEAANRTRHVDGSESPCNADGSVLVAQAPRRLLTQLSARAPPVPPPATLAGADATRPNRSVTELPPSERPACWEDVSAAADAPVVRHGLEADATPAAPARAPSLLNRGRRPLWGCACLAPPQTLYGDDSD